MELVNPGAWLAEAIATFALVLFGPMSVTISVVIFELELSLLSILAISFAHGAVIAIMVYVFGHISGAHINPAVTIPMMITRRIGLADGFAYIGSQIIGAIIGTLVHKAILRQGEAIGWGLHKPTELLDYDPVATMLVEVVLTFFLVMTVFAVAVHKKAPAGWAGFAIGGIIFLNHIVGVPLTGAGMNPARSFGPALVTMDFAFHWVFWVGPIIGGILGGVLYYYAFIYSRNKGSSD
jgi:aquaporin-4